MARDVSRPLIHRLTIGLIAASLAAPAQLRAQARDPFVEALVAFSQAAAGTYGSEGPALRDALDRMTDGLARWDAAVARVEAGFAGAIKGAPPRDAAQMRATLGATLLERGRVTDALPHLAAAASLDAPSVHVLRGLARLRAGEPAVAATDFSAALTRDSKDLSAALLFIHAARGAGPSKERELAMTALFEGVTGLVAGTSAPAVAILPLDLLDDGSVDEPLFPPSAYARGLGLIRDARYAEALTSLRMAADGDPLTTDAALATAEARSASAALRNPDATAAAQMLLSVPGHSTSSEIQRLLGVSYWTLEDYPRSLEHLRTAVRLDARNERARLSLADVLVAARNPAAARDTLQQTIAAFPASGQAHWRLARLSQEIGDEAGAVRAYEAAARQPVFAGAAAVYAAIGRLRHNALDLEAAAKAYERRVGLTPLARDAHLDLGGVYRAQDRIDAALAEYLIAALLDPRSARAFAAVGQVRADMGDDQGALAMLRRAIALDPMLLDARYAASRALLRLGRADEARQELLVFERLQREAMEAQRRQFEENARAIEDALRAPPGGAGR
jgi:tetratricopeptide (TPR) repeat protein